MPLQRRYRAVRTREGNWIDYLKIGRMCGLRQVSVKILDTTGRTALKCLHLNRLWVRENSLIDLLLGTGGAMPRPWALSPRPF
jgi:hypothetical protein